MSRATKLRLARIDTDKSAARVARDLGIAPATYRTYERGENKAPIDVANRIAKYFHKTLEEIFNEEMRLEILEPAPAPPIGGRDLPILGSARGGADGFDLDSGTAVASYIERPANLLGVTEAYAVYVYGDNMEPRYFAGEILHINPHRPIFRGSFVVVQLVDLITGSIHGVIKRFVRRSDVTLVTEQLNLPKEISFAINTVRAVHVIVGLSSN